MRYAFQDDMLSEEGVQERVESTPSFLANIRWMQGQGIEP